MQETIQIAIHAIRPNRNQPRMEFNHESLIELSESIKENGLIHPIIVREIEDGYEIIAGERRFRACMLAGFEWITAIVSDSDELKATEIALVENIQREDLTAVEEAKAYRKLLDEYGMTQESMAKRVGKSQSSIANKLRLLNLSTEIQNAVTLRTITERHARAVLMLEPTAQKEVFDQIIKNNLTVTETEKLVKEYLPKPEKKVVKGFSKDSRIAINSIQKMIKTIKEMGIAVKAEKEEDEKGITFTIHLPR